MLVTSRSTLPLGGFAGLTEHRLVTDSRIFRRRKASGASEGIGNFVYLADANFNPYGETGMHPHHEIDVISVMVEGRVAHEGSLEHGKSLNTGDAQVQRAGGEGFSHNEVNPDNHQNRMLQLWVAPEVAGEPASYKHYSPKAGATTRIYGGEANQTETIPAKTTIDVVHLEAGGQYRVDKEILVYVFKGTGAAQEGKESGVIVDGDLVRASSLDIISDHGMSFIAISTL